MDRMKEFERREQMVASLIAADGGPGSGNYGHAGRPGKVGGSAKGSGGSVFRAGTKESGYSSFTKNKVFAGIASNARAATSRGNFISRMSKEQKDAIRAQHAACGTGESLSDYADRMYEMLHNRGAKSEIRQQNKPVNGKDISQTWTSTVKGNWADGPTKAIDTDIEDVLHQQGFDGVPKVVSQAELERIIKGNPKSPILYRSYTALDEEELEGFDNDLEHGFFYVDCSEGGAGFGQGMYCAGVYQREPLLTWDDPEFEPEDLAVTKIEGQGFVLRECKFEPEEKEAGAVSVMPGIYAVLDKDGNKRIIECDEESGIFTDEKGRWIEEDEVSDIVRNGKFFELEGKDVSSYEKTADQDRERGIAGAMEEMRHYRSLGINKKEGTVRPIVPDGMSTLCHDANGKEEYYYFDPKEETNFFASRPGPGELIAVRDVRHPSWGSQLWKVKADGSGLESAEGPVKAEAYWSDFDDDNFRWSGILGECETKEAQPVASTRMMTLDPSAKIIKYNDLEKIKRKASTIRQDAKNKVYEMKNAALEEVDFNDAWFESKLVGAALGEDIGELTRENIAKITEYRKTHPERMARLQKLFDDIKSVQEEAEQAARPYDKFTYMDMGVLAAIHGYDAIDAEGHGASGSYTVVLNRTKVILSEDRVEVR